MSASTVLDQILIDEIDDVACNDLDALLQESEERIEEILRECVLEYDHGGGSSWWEVSALYTPGGWDEDEFYDLVMPEVRRVYIESFARHAETRYFCPIGQPVIDELRRIDIRRIQTSESLA